MKKRLLAFTLSLLILIMSSGEAFGSQNYTRIYGKNRIETAVEISKSIQKESKVAVLANSTRYVDALAGSTLANLMNAPILLVGEKEIPKATTAELKRLGVEKIYLLGGEAVISREVEKSLGEYEIIRLWGQNRYETSYKIYKEIEANTEIKEVYLASNEADAVASSASRGKNIPLLLVSDQVPSFMKEISVKKIVLGGVNALSEKTFRDLKAHSRIAGKNRFETAIALAKVSPKTNTILVNAYNFVDAFTAGPYAYRKNANILLTSTDVFTSASKAYIENKKGNLLVIGGENAISSQIFEEGDSTNDSNIAYWDKYNKYGKTVLLSTNEIEAYNRKIDKESGNVQNILEISNKFSKKWINDRINLYQMPGNPTRRNGSSYPAATKNAWLANRDISGIKDRTAQYAVAVQRSLLRSFPTNDGNVKEGYHDYFAEDAVNPWEEMMIVHTSKDGAWHFVLTENYSGWIQAKDIAITNKATLQKYKNYNFYVVTEPKISVNGINMDMGTRIPMEKGKALLAGRDAKGGLTVKSTGISSGVHSGYLPYTEYNLFKQALKFRGEPYGWGGSNNSHDCSSFIEDVHKSFGIRLARNTSHQEGVAMKGKISIGKLSRANKLKAIQKSGPASVIYMKGHVVLYLGKDAKGQDKIIHQNGSTKNCAITNLDFGGSYLNSYSTIQKYR